MDFICFGGECNPPIRFAQLAMLAFLAVLFLQSGFDKVLNWKDELGWIRDHFAKTPFKNFVPQLLGVITVFEVASGVASALGFVMLLFTGGKTMAILAVSLSTASLVQLFAGQRIAKDYAGAGALVPYFLVTIVGFGLLSV